VRVSSSLRIAAAWGEISQQFACLRRLGGDLDRSTTVIDDDGLIYCEGSEGEQLEFVQALGPVKTTSGRAVREKQPGAKEQQYLLARFAVVL
jgi:hypothetical protein